MEPLQTWWATELYPSKDEDTFGVAGDFEVVRAADAQATIAALQARVQELEEWKRIVTGAGTDQESVIRLAAHEYTKPAIQCWKEANAKLESQLTQRTVELHETQNHLADADNEVEQLRKQLSERTAELEAASKAIAEWRKEIDSVLDKLDDREGDVVALQAELERVRGELVEARDYDKLREQNRVLRSNLVNCAARLEAYYGEDYPAVRDAKAALTATSQEGQP